MYIVEGSGNWLCKIFGHWYREDGIVPSEYTVPAGRFHYLRCVICGRCEEDRTRSASTTDQPKFGTCGCGRLSVNTGEGYACTGCCSWVIECDCDDN
jgi:hypothetical protein